MLLYLHRWLENNFIMDSLLPAGMDPSKIPIGTPPPGVTPNFVDPPSMSWAGRLAVYTTLPLMVVFVALRIYVRGRSRLLGPDDSTFQRIFPVWT